MKHCYHHEPTAMLAQMLILMLGFVLFTGYAVLHSQPMRLGHTTFEELAHDLDLASEEALPWDLWFGSGSRRGGAALREIVLCQFAERLSNPWRSQEQCRLVLSGTTKKSFARLSAFPKSFRGRTRRAETFHFSNC